MSMTSSCCHRLHFSLLRIVFVSLALALVVCVVIHGQAVTYAEGEALAREYKISFFETSAMTDVNVDQAFMHIVREVRDRIENEDPTAEEGEKKKKKKGRKLKEEDAKPTKKKGGCC